MILSAVRIALRELRRNVLRSALTTLGVVIGVGAVIVMVTLGNGATAKVSADIASMGSNLLTLMPGQRLGPGGSSGGAKPFKDSDVEAIAQQVPNLAWVAPISNASANIVYGNKNRSVSVVGTTNDYFYSGNWRLDDGRWFNDVELQSGRTVCVIGETIRKELFGAQDPLGARLRIRGVSCDIIGVLASKGRNTFGQDRDDTVLMPLRTFQRRISGVDDVQQVQMSVNGTSTKKTQGDIELLLRERRRLGPTDDNDFTVMDMQELASTLTGTTRILTALLAAVAAVSLLVGGIGIMNIMLVSVTERTREIGIRMAIGALEREVLTQFLVEAVVLSSFGGTLGIILASATAFAGARALGLPFTLDVRIVVLAFLFSAAVGVVFGFVPARRAAALNPIDALRHE